MPVSAFQKSREVVVRGVLTAEDRPGGRHLLLDEGVADPGAYGRAAVLADHLGHGPGRDEVVDHGAAGVAGQLAGGDQRGDRGRRDRLTALVHDEAAVGVAVEGETQVRALGDDAGLEVHDVGRVERVGLVVGEGAVELEVHRDQVEGQAVEHGGHGVPAHAVARVDHDLQGADGGEVDQGQEMGRVVGQRVALDDRARLRGRGRRALPRPLLDQRADLGEAGVLADRRRALAAHLDAVVLGRVVRGGEHGARQVEGAGRVVELVGGAQSDERDVRAERCRAARESRGETGRGGAHVVADDDGVGAASR